MTTHYDITKLRVWQILIRAASRAGYPRLPKLRSTVYPDKNPWKSIYDTRGRESNPRGGRMNPAHLPPGQARIAAKITRDLQRSRKRYAKMRKLGFVLDGFGQWRTT
jgi:hypothetical protein